VLLFAAAPAQAAFSVGLTSSADTTTQAGAPTDFTTDATFPDNEDVQRLTFHLPPGLVGNPNVTPLCPQTTFNGGTCPADTQVGTTSVTATVGVVPGVVSTGEVFNLEPSPGEPARLGVDVHTALGDIKIPVSASLRPSDGGLDATTASDIPNCAGPSCLVPVHVTEQVLTLQGQPPLASGPFITNPTGCPTPPDQTKVDATSYSSSTASAAADYPVTGCELLPFAPQMTATADVSGGSAVGTHIALDTIITQTPGQANPKRVKVTLPDAIDADQTALARVCPPADQAAFNCPAISKIGEATAETPLLSQPLTGNVYAANTGMGLLGFAVQFTSPVQLELDGGANLPNFIIVSTFDNVPDVPLSKFALHFDNGPNGSLLAGQDLCTIGPQTVQGEFLAHSGATATQTPTMAVNGCPPAAKDTSKPHATVRAKHLGGPRPKVVVHILAGGADLTGATVKLPGALKVRRGHGKVKAGSTGRVKTKLGAHKIKLTNVPSGARRLNLTLSKGAVSASRSLRRKLRHHSKAKLGFKVVVNQKDAAAVTLHVTAKGKR
jgi:hypothetical protein